MMLYYPLTISSPARVVLSHVEGGKGSLERERGWGYNSALRLYRYAIVTRPFFVAVWVSDHSFCNALKLLLFCVQLANFRRYHTMTKTKAIKIKREI